MKLIEELIIKLCTLLGINLLGLAYRALGIGAEHMDLQPAFFSKLLRDKLKKENDLLFFDVGANVGDVTSMLVKTFPSAQIHCFEPNPHTFQKLKTKITAQNIFLNNLALGEQKSTTSIYYYSNDVTTGHASLMKNVFDLHKNGDVEETPVSITTIDNYCTENAITSIDFLKIDTEGYEYFVLKGAIRMLSKSQIKIIQFEFNEMNLISKVTLRDFYALLTNFEFYRIKSDKLYPLGQYSSANEIYRLQNLLAIRKSTAN